MKFLVNVSIVSLLLALVLCKSNRDKLFFLERSGDEGETLLVVTWSEGKDEISAGCEIFKDKDLINEVLKSSDDAPIRTLSEDEMASVLGDCTESTLRRRRRQAEESSAELSSEVYLSDYELDAGRRSQNNQDSRQDSLQGTRAPTISNGNNFEETTLPTTGDPTTLPTTGDPTTEGGFMQGLPAIFPGTKWCGAGDIAKNYDDLGLHQDTDRCCRAHDLCNETMAPQETKNGLTNKSPFTALSCQCDEDFYNCLTNINSITSNTVGNMYFNILKRPCYEEDYPDSKRCKKFRTFLKLKCIEYEKDTSKPKENRWKPAKKYMKIPFPGPFDVTLPF